MRNKNASIINMFTSEEFLVCHSVFHSVMGVVFHIKIMVYGKSFTEKVFAMNVVIVNYPYFLTKEFLFEDRI